jgi:isopenicillin-N epimerase
VKDSFLLDPGVVYLNHGSFGACPRPVFEAYQHWQRELERQPVEFLALERGLPALLDEARRALAAYVGARPESLTFVPDATTGVNAGARSPDRRPGDQGRLGGAE